MAEQGAGNFPICKQKNEFRRLLQLEHFLHNLIKPFRCPVSCLHERKESLSYRQMMIEGEMTSPIINLFAGESRPPLPAYAFASATAASGQASRLQERRKSR